MGFRSLFGCFSASGSAEETCRSSNAGSLPPLEKFSRPLGRGLPSSASIDDNIRDGIMEVPCGVSVALDTMQQQFQKPGSYVARDVQKVRQLGKGGFGVVWLATVNGGTEYIALKELNKPIMFQPGSEKSVQRLKDALPAMEAAIQTLMVHQNIVRTHWVDVSCVDPVTYEPLDINVNDLLQQPVDQSAEPDASGQRSGLSAAGDSGEWMSVDHLLKLNASGNMDALPDVVGLNMRIAMDYCEYGALIDYLRKGTDRHERKPALQDIGNRLTRRECVELTARDLARAIRLMHLHDVIHADLKPHNVLLAADDEDPRGFVAKVTDFGLSRRLAKGAAEVAGISMGTPAYMAPESLRDLAITKKSDIYAFGLILWELWTGKQWCVQWNLELKRRTPSGARPQPKSMADFKPRSDPTCPAKLADVIERCLHSDPAARPNSKALKHLLDDCIAECSATLRATKML